MTDQSRSTKLPRTDSILDSILERTLEDVALRKSLAPRDVLERRAGRRPEALSLRTALQRPGMSVIAEFKRASPSKGRFPVEIEPEDVARSYVAGGASAISVLTDEPFFQGSLGDLAAVGVIARPNGVPILRKDFIVDEYQILEARAAGADAILLIVAALDDARLAYLAGFAASHGMDALVEVHDGQEMVRAADVGATIIGINNRDLKSFRVDLVVSETLAPTAPGGAVVVAESGIASREDVERLAAVGVDAILVGESLILSDDRAAAIGALIGVTEQS